jgi:hypothetical protein
MMVAYFRMSLAGMLLLSAGFGSVPASAAEEFPFGLEITLDVPPQPGSKRIPNLEIGDRGEVRLELWCKGGVGQFSVAGNTVIFVPGAMDDRSCSPTQVQMDDALLAELVEATTWTRRGDYVSFTGRTTLRFHLNTN